MKPPGDGSRIASFAILARSALRAAEGTGMLGDQAAQACNALLKISDIQNRYLDIFSPTPGANLALS
jgi:hypothetical protein